MAHEVTAHDTASALREAERFEQRLAVRTAGITTMIWGLVSAGIFLTYGAADPYFEEIDAPWAYAFLWLPWIAAGIGITQALWGSHAVATATTEDHRKGVLVGIGFSGIFFVLAAGLFLGLDVLAGVEWTIASIMVVVNGLFAWVIATMEKKIWQYRDQPLWAAGAVMVVAGIAMGVGGVAEGASGMVGGLIAGAAWITSGAVNYRRG